MTRPSARDVFRETPLRREAPAGGAERAAPRGRRVACWPESVVKGSCCCRASSLSVWPQSASGTGWGGGCHCRGPGMGAACGGPGWSLRAGTPAAQVLGGRGPRIPGREPLRGEGDPGSRFPFGAAGTFLPREEGCGLRCAAPPGNLSGLGGCESASRARSDGRS